MKYERMAEITDSLIAQERGIRETKGREYADDTDTLADFKEVAAEAGITPLQCWLVYERKHSRAIGSAIRRGGATLSESLADRILDVRVYHALLLGLAEDEAQRVQQLTDVIKDAQSTSQQQTQILGGFDSGTLGNSAQEARTAQEMVQLP
jgi:hypothetical protein